MPFRRPESDLLNFQLRIPHGGEFGLRTPSKLDRVRNLFEPMIIEAMQVPADLDYPGNARIYLEHLRQLGLVEISVTRAPEPIMEEGIQVAVRNFAEHQLSLWGIQFMRAVTKPDN